MKTIIFKSILTSIFLFMIVSVTQVEAQTMYLTITDNGSPSPTSTDSYYIVIDVVKLYNGFIIQHYTPNNVNQSISCNGYSNPWSVDVSCSDGPTEDVEAYIFRVDYTVVRDETPLHPPYIASGSSSSPLQNSDSFYANFTATVTIN